MVFAVPLLAAADITETYKKLLRETFPELSEADNALISKFKSYIRRFWMNKDPKKLSFFGLDTSTNNGCESWHAGLKRKMPVAHPPIWKWTSKMNDILEDKANEFKRFQIHESSSVVR